MAAMTIQGVEGLKALEGQHLGYSDWLEITQERINQFAEATGDHQWIHVDVDRAKAESPFGGPIAHGYLTLSIGPRLMPQVLNVTGFSTVVNYGANKVRFPAPVPAGSKVREGIEIIQVDGSKTSHVDVVYKATFEVEGQEKPACVAEIIIRYVV